MDQYPLHSGPLRSTITIELHTHRATQIWQGRRGVLEEEIYPIIGMQRFLGIMEMLRRDAAQDNPYADMWMLVMEERLLGARQEMNRLIEEARQVFKSVPDTITVDDCYSIEPVTLPLFASTQLGYIAVYLLTDFDALARKVLQAHHIAIITRAEYDDWFLRGSRMIRSIFSLAQRYPRVPVTRQDFIDSHIRAHEAEKQFGPVPPDILDGSRHSQYAPPLQRLSLSQLPDSVMPEEEPVAADFLSQDDPAPACLPDIPADADTTEEADDESA